MNLIDQHRKQATETDAYSPTIVDLHPDRPTARGLWPPTSPNNPVARLPADPTFEEITAAKGVVELHGEPHTIANGAIYVSGNIERRTQHETGLFGGCQYVDGQWQKGPGNPGWLIMDERYMAINVRNKGLVVFSSCSRATFCTSRLMFLADESITRFWNRECMHVCPIRFQSRRGPPVRCHWRLSSRRSWNGRAHPSNCQLFCQRTREESYLSIAFALYWLQCQSSPSKRTWRSCCASWCWLQNGIQGGMNQLTMFIAMALKPM